MLPGLRLQLELLRLLELVLQEPRLPRLELPLELLRLQELLQALPPRQLLELPLLEVLQSNPTSSIVNSR